MLRHHFCKLLISAACASRTTSLTRPILLSPRSLFTSKAASALQPPPPSLDLINAQFTSNTLITGQELASLITHNQTGIHHPVLIIDVRTPNEIAKHGMIPTSVALPLNELQQALALPHNQFQLMYQFPKPSRESSNIVMYCKAGVRAETALTMARELGYKKVRCYYGSFNEWEQQFIHVVPTATVEQEPGVSTPGKV